MGEIVIFSKSKCPHCLEAKAIFSQLDIPYTEINIDDDLKNSMLMSRVSGRHTVPQIFFNEQHIGGTTELKSLDQAALESQVNAALSASNKPGFLTNAYSDAELEAAVIPIKDIIDPFIPEDPTAIPEYAAVRIWYADMFGFLCNLYDQMILKPEPTALWIAVLSSAMAVVEKKIGAHFGTACFSTAITAGCAYCSAHGADLSMKFAGERAASFKALTEYLVHKNGSLHDLPFDDDLKVIINLASKMTDHSITVEDIGAARAVFGVDALREACHSVGAMGIIMGFLNRFNDLIGVEIEASIKQSIDNSAVGENWDWGTHDTEDAANRYPVRDATGQPVKSDRTALKALIHGVKDKVFAEVDTMTEKYADFPDEQLPLWLASLPDADTTRTVSALYHALFNTGELSAELKHLAAYTLTIGSGYTALAAEEARIAALTATSAHAMGAKLACARRFAASGDLADTDGLDSRERLALRLAKCADSFPHIVRGELVQALAREYSAAEIVELVMALAVIGMGQRWVGVLEPFSDYCLTH